MNLNYDQVLVTGSSGFVGSCLCRELLKYGYKVRALCRPSSNLGKLSDLKNIEIVIGDVTDPQSLLKAFIGVKAVFHIAALYREARFPDSEYWRVNFEGTRNVLEAAQKSGVQKIIHCSTIGVHSHIAFPPANEQEPYAPTDIYQESKTEAEKLVLEWFREKKIGGSVIRPAMIWGPGDTRFRKLFDGIKNRRFPLIGSGETLCHWILVDDLVRAFRLALESSHSDGQVYIIAGRKPVTLRYTMETIAKFYAVKLWPLSIPVLPVQLLGSLCEMICKPFGIEPPLHRRRADFFIKNRAFDCSKAKRDLGFEAGQSFEEEVQLTGRSYETS